MFKINYSKLALLGAIVIGSFIIAISTPAITGQAAPVALNSEQRSQLLSDWQKQVTAWQRASTVSASTVSGNMLGSQVAQLPDTGYMKPVHDSVIINSLKTIVLSGTLALLIVLIKGQPWQTLYRTKK
ncbi:hypothetical protein H7Y63_00485 [Polaromonas sp.]|nr:hypothetical protein [Candidatus Saccharibacteria bacterium]